MERAAQHVLRLGVPAARVGVESAFLPADAYMVLRRVMRDVALVDASDILARVRAIKTDRERALLRESVERVLASMQAAFGSVRPGQTKRDISIAM